MKTKKTILQAYFIVICTVFFISCGAQEPKKDNITETAPPTADCDDRAPAPQGSVCDNNCLLEFDGYWWWTNYPFNIVPNSGYWFNNQQWDPRLAFVDDEGLHLQMQQTTIPGAPGAQWSSIEVLLWAPTTAPDSNGLPERFYPGYGTYLVAAQTSPDFNALSNNCCFGAFTYAFNADNSITNTHHELDMAEISRWGNLSDPTNGQFTLQPWGSLDSNVHRITLQAKNEITLVMNWAYANQPVTFSLYYGLYELSNLPATPDITWTTAADQNQFIPTAACQTVHFNLWRQPQTTYPSGNQEVIIKNFEFKARG